MNIFQDRANNVVEWGTNYENIPVCRQKLHVNGVLLVPRGCRKCIADIHLEAQDSPTTLTINNKQKHDIHSNCTIFHGNSYSFGTHRNFSIHNNLLWLNHGKRANINNGHSFAFIAKLSLASCGPLYSDTPRSCTPFPWGLPHKVAIVLLPTVSSCQSALWRFLSLRLFIAPFLPVTFALPQARGRQQHFALVKESCWRDNGFGWRRQRFPHSIPALSS